MTSPYSLLFSDITYSSNFKFQTKSIIIVSSFKALDTWKTSYIVETAETRSWKGRLFLEQPVEFIGRTNPFSEQQAHRSSTTPINVPHPITFRVHLI